MLAGLLTGIQLNLTTLNNRPIVGPGPLKCEIYTDNAGRPGTLIGSTVEPSPPTPECRCLELRSDAWSECLGHFRHELPRGPVHDEPKRHVEIPHRHRHGWHAGIIIHRYQLGRRGATISGFVRS